MLSKTAIVVGATGATGKHMVEKLLAHPDYSQVVALARKPLGTQHEKLSTHQIDFDRPDTWQNLIKGDELFSAMGTTLKLAGSKQAQRKVDVGYQQAAAEAAKQNGVSSFILVSSPNANSKSPNFYLKTKGEMEDIARKLNFQQCLLIQPSLIEAVRPEGRPAEKIGSFVLNRLVKLLPPLKRYRPISADELASAAINAAQIDFGSKVTTLKLDQLFDFL